MTCLVGRPALGPLVACFLLALAPAGCGKGYPVAEVDGVLLLHGKPGTKVQVQFVPNIDKGSTGPISTAETDAQGRFQLRLMQGDGSPRSGVVVGWHRVVLTDLRLAESATGKGVPIRFGPEYTLASSTPLTREVKEGKQTIEIKLP